MSDMGELCGVCYLLVSWFVVCGVYGWEVGFGDYVLLFWLAIRQNIF